MVTSLCSCSPHCVYAQQLSRMNVISLSPEAGPKGVLSFLNACVGFFFLWLDVKSHVTSLTYFCILVTRLHLLSSNNKSFADEGLLFIRAETLKTLEKSWRLKGSRNTEPFIFTESHVSNWDPPAVVLNLCPSEEIEKMAGQAISNA